MNSTAKKPVIDLHCDLLYYLIDKPQNSPLDLKARCSLPQLQEGGVGLQAMAVFTETAKGSTQSAAKQIEAYKKLPSFGFSPLQTRKTNLQPPTVQTIMAIENASGLLEEDEDLELIFKRIEKLEKEVGPLLYISLTWNTENRFAGGNYSQAGLKADGKTLLEYLSGKGICIDLSHTSDATAEGIFDTIDKKGLKIKAIASHSNFRKVKDHVRNLPDHLALEIVKRDGLIGLNFVRGFVSDQIEEGFKQMLAHADRLNALDHLCFGADFFCVDGLPTTLNTLVPFFVAPFDTSACYPKFLPLIPEGSRDQISHKNALNLIGRL